MQHLLSLLKQNMLRLSALNGESADQPKSPAFKGRSARAVASAIRVPSVELTPTLPNRA